MMLSRWPHIVLAGNIEMPLVPDERLMAYADGELPPEEARALEIMIAEDPDLAARVAPFLATRTPKAELYHDMATERVPRHLIEAIRAFPIDKAPRRQQPTESLDLQSWLAALNPFTPGTRWQFDLSQATVACVMILAGTAVGWSAAKLTTSELNAPLVVAAENGSLVAAGSLSEALETAPSSAINADHGKILPVLTFKSSLAGYSFCREYKVINGQDSRFSGVACRSTASPTWRVLSHAYTGKHTVPSSGSKHVTASSGGGATAAVSAVVDTIIDGDALGQDAEQRLLATGWKASQF